METTKIGAGMSREKERGVKEYAKTNLAPLSSRGKTKQDYETQIKYWKDQYMAETIRHTDTRIAFKKLKQEIDRLEGRFDKGYIKTNEGAQASIAYLNEMWVHEAANWDDTFDGTSPF